MIFINDYHYYRACSLQKDVAIGVGWTGLVPFHKEEGVSLLKELDLHAVHGEEMDESNANALGDRGHERIVASGQRVSAIVS